MRIEKSKILWGIGSVACLGISYWLCRFVFYEMHRMKQWSNVLAIVGLIIIIIASVYEKRKLSVATVIGYIGGFALAMVFRTEGLDPGGGSTNNAWIIWGCVFILAVIAGLYMDKGSRIVSFVCTLIVLARLVTILFMELFKQFTALSVFVPVLIIIGLALFFPRIKNEAEKRNNLS